MGALKAGYGRVEITPPVGAPLCGYRYFPERRAEGVADPLYVRAVAFDDGEPALLLVFDLIGFDSLLVRRVQSQIIARTGIGRERVMLSCIHTHSGPNVLPLRGNPRRSGRYLKEVVAAGAEAAELALDDSRKVAEARRFRKGFEGFSWNRAFADAGTCQEVAGLSFRTRNRTIVLVNYACHPVTLGINREISADYPGAFNEHMSRDGFSSIFLTGPCGDLDPVVNRDRWGQGTRDELIQYAGLLSEATLEGIKGGTSFHAERVESATGRLRAAYRAPDGELVRKVLTEAREVSDDRDGKARFEIDWAEETLRCLESGDFPRSVGLRLQAFGIGEGVILALPGEVFFEFGEEMRRSLPGLEVLIATNANEVVGYISSARDSDAGGYASDLSCKFYGRFPLEREIGGRLVERSVRLVKSLRPPSRDGPG